MEQINSTHPTKGAADTVNFFPHLPPYSDSNIGFISRLPRSWIPYAQLMRLDRHAGLYAFYFPYLIGTIYAACIAKEAPTPQVVLSLAIYFLPFTVLLRGIACTWNDNVDQDFDRRVARCRHRPIARGAVSTLQGHIFTIVQLVVFMHLVMKFPESCTLHAVTIIALFLVYALMKRITYYPQVFLGFPFAWAIFFCKNAFGIETADNLEATMALVGANILWTIIYDTIYAHQDIKYDEEAGVKSMALRFKHYTKPLCSILSMAQVILLVLCGVWSGFGRAYFVGTVGGVALSLAYFIYDVNLLDPESCGRWFQNQFWIVGISFIAGLSTEYACRVGSEHMR